MLSPKILVVEDSISIRKTLELRLKDVSSEIMTASDGVEGLKKAQEQEFDLILSDVDMPNMDGLEMLTELKKVKRTRGIPIILLSFMDSAHDVEKGYQAGAAAYVKKASSSEELKKVIKDVFEKAVINRKSEILVVDDSLTTRTILESGLGKSGFKVQTACDGKMALELLEEYTPQLIISDLDMPVMTGIELCQHLQEDKRLARIPILIISANGERSVMRSMIEQGASSYLVKPFNMEQLVITAEKLLSEQFQLLVSERERLTRERNMMLASITSLIQALEARDPYTRGHSERVSSMAVELGKHMNLSKSEIETLKVGGKLHDLGKIGVPDNVLLKKGQLTTDEYEEISKHPAIGAEILSSIQSLKKIIPIVLHHHERIDGKGHPSKLEGEEIPLLARITAVVDSYDAMTSDRPYRKGLSPQTALGIIQDIKGTQLCRDCVDAFVEYIGQSVLSFQISTS